MTRTALRLLATLPLLALAACAGQESNGDAGPLRCPPGTVANADNTRCVQDREGGSSGADADRADTDESDAVDDTRTPDTSTDATPDAVADTGGPCADGAIRCNAAGIPESCVGGAWVETAACPPGDVCLAGRCVDGVGCTAGDVRGCFSETEQSVCADDGARYQPRACDEGLWCFEGVCGPQRCRPGEQSCAADGYTVLLCAPSGEEWVNLEVCDRRASRVCSGGECVSGCIAAVKDPSYVGCEYWSVDLPQYEDPTTAGPEIPHAVVLSNVSEYPARVTFESTGSRRVPPPVDVAAGDVVAVEFPRFDVFGTEQTSNSYRIVTTEPIVAYQFNPLNNVNLFSNDASLMLPISAIDRDYYVMGWPGGASIEGFGFPAQRAFMTVVAPSAGTTRVQITFSTNVVDGSVITGIRTGTTRAFSLSQGEVLNFSCETSLSTFTPCDFTGTRVTGDRPIIVFAGHEQAVIGEDGGDGNCCADHLEEQLFPISAWGTRYMAVHSPPRGTEPDYWKVLAAEDGTRIVTNPSIPELDGITLNAGEFAEINTPQSFEIEATGPILVGQFLVSQQSAGVSRTVGDPSFILSVPVTQFRPDYRVLVPDGYREDYLTVIRPVGAALVLDGAPITASFTPFGSREYEYAHLPLEPGPHALSSPDEVPFGVLGYGYDGAVSYGYPGGLNLTGVEEDTSPIP